MSESTHGVPASGVDRRSEMIKSFGERPVPPVDQLVVDFGNRRADIEMKLRDLQAQPGFKLDTLQAQERRKRITECEADLSELNDLWLGLGGDKIDAANKQIDDLNFQSDATDHVGAKGNLVSAKSEFYDNFVALHEEALARESDESASDEFDNSTLEDIQAADLAQNSEPEPVAAQRVEDDTATPTKKPAHVEVSPEIEQGWNLSHNIKRLDTELGDKRVRYGKLMDKSGETATQLHTEIKNTEQALEDAKCELKEFTDNQDKPQPGETPISDNDSQVAAEINPNKSDLTSDREAILEHIKAQGGLAPERVEDTSGAQELTLDRETALKQVVGEGQMLTTDREAKLSKMREPSEPKPQELSGDREGIMEKMAKIEKLTAIENPTDAQQLELKGLTADVREYRKKVAVEAAEKSKESDSAEENADNEPSLVDMVNREKAKQREEQKTRIEHTVLQTVEGMQVHENYQSTLAEYGRCAAEVATKDGRIGRRKREEALRVAEENLTAAHLAYIKLIDSARDEQGMYDDLESKEAADQARSDDFLDHFRQLQRESRQAKLTARLDQVQNRNVIQRGLVRMGNWLNDGKTNTRNWMRAAGTGAGVGALVATGAILTGVGIPVTIAATMGAGFGTRYGAKMAVLDKFLYEELGKDADSSLFDETFRTASAHSKDRDEAASVSSREIFSTSRSTSKEELTTASAQGTKTGTRFGLGMAAGGAAVHAGHALSNMMDGNGHDVASAKQAPDSNGRGNDQISTRGTDQPQIDYNTNVDHAGTGPEIGGGAHVETPVHTPELSLNPDISRGEGWYHQLHDMGFTQSQGETMYGDDKLMRGLENIGAAYRDSSIGGWGINMPADGHLSDAAVELIRQHGIEHGFIK